jgi:sterol desaturase/sphingolipid hydroxylase (fatty acid hydroxylase superfamily)
MDFGLTLYNIFVSTYLFTSLYTISDEVREYGHRYVCYVIKKSYKYVFLNVVVLPYFISFIFLHYKIYSDEFNLIIWVRDCLINWISVDILFWTIHRILHFPIFYSLIHKKHHEFKRPIGFTSLYATPIDFLVSNFPPIFFALIILRSHYTLFYFWTCISTFNTIYISHSKNDRFHVIHHESFIYNYGINIFMDKLCRTNKVD